MEKRTATVLANSNLSKDFFVRNRGNTIKDALLFVSSAALILTAVVIIQNKLAAVSIILTLFGLISCFIAKDTNKQKEFLKITEFQSALFASSLGMGYDFAFIVDLVRQRIFYINPEFQKVFPMFQKQNDRSIAKFFELSGIAEDAKTMVSDAWEQKLVKNLVVDITVNGESKKVDLFIDMIPRPEGFALVRGRIIS